MTALRTLLVEFAGLFVEDRSFALTIALWLAFALALISGRVVPATLAGALLFAGLALLLIVGVARSSRG